MRISSLSAGLRVTVVATAFLFAAVASVQAEMTPKNLQVAARSLAFLTGRDISKLKIAIIYSPDVLSSKKEAEALAALLNSSFTAGRVTLVAVPPVLLGIGNLPALDNKDVAFVTDDLRQWHSAIAEAAKPRRIVTVTSDLDCVTNGYCVMGVQAEPRVQILINRAAALQSSIDFAPGFRLLVSEL